MKVAILDLGTNTFHLFIAEVGRGSSWKKLVHNRITVKIGKGGINKKTIAGPAYARGIKALGKFRETINRLGVKKITVFGTAALRNAENGPQFLEEVKKKFKFHIQLISGDEEASLIYYGVRQAVNLGEKKSLIMDIGGGSVEFIIANETKIFWKRSFKLGAALLSDKFRPSDPLRAGEIKNIQLFFKQELEPLIKACQQYSPHRLIGSAGSFETFASMIRHKFPRAGSHYGKTSHPIAFDHFQTLHSELIVSDAADRNNMKGLIKMRVDMIVMASLLLKFVLDKTKIEKIVLSAYSLKEGALWK